MQPVEHAIATARTASGKTLAELSSDAPVLLVFLRHSGCPFCRQTLKQLARLKDKLSEAKMRLVIVHMDTPEKGAAWIASYGLDGSEQISDPDSLLYQQFGLGKTSWWNLVGPHTWWSGFRATILEMHGVSKIVGDIKQLTGAFVIERGKVIRQFRQRLSSDQPDWQSMVCEV